MNQIPDEVCHFTKTETGFTILSTKNLRLGIIKNTNDPRETKARSFGVAYLGNSSFAQNPDREEIATKINNEADRIGMEEWKVLCVSLHNPLKKSDDPFTAIYNQRIRPAYCNPAMWAHYGENHKGICLIFNGKTLHRKIHEKHKDDCRIYSGRVQYGMTRSLVAAPLIAINNDKADFTNLIRSHYFLYIKNIFLRKQPSWKYENEYRWLLYSPDNLPKFVPIEVSIKEVIVGSDFPSAKEAIIIELCKDLKIPAGKMDWKDGLAALRSGNIYQP